MPRKTHRPEESREDIRCRLFMHIPETMRAFLDIEAKRLSEERGKLIKRGDVVRALITAYYEKRMAGLLVNPDD